MASGSTLQGETKRVQPTNRLVAAMEDATQAQLMEHMRLCTLKSGEVLYEPGAVITDAFFPLSCVISLVAVLSDGKSAEVCVFGCEGVVGYASAQVSRQAFGRYIVQIGGPALRISLRDLRRAARVNPDLQDILRRYVEALLLQTFQTLACNTFHSVEARCCRWILSTEDRVGRQELPLTHELLAEMLGTQRSTLSTVMKRLAAAGVVAQHRGRIRILNKAQLEQGACECYFQTRSHYERLISIKASEK